MSNINDIECEGLRLDYAKDVEQKIAYPQDFQLYGKELKYGKNLNKERCQMNMDNKIQEILNNQLLNPSQQEMALNYALIFLRNETESISKTILNYQMRDVTDPILDLLIQRKSELEKDNKELLNIIENKGR